MLPKVALLINRNIADKIFAEPARKMLSTLAQVDDWDALPDQVTPQWMAQQLQGAQIAITCWGTPSIEEEILTNAQDLRFIAHAAGSPKGMCSVGVVQRGIRVTSAAPILGTDVAETTIGLMIYGCKRMSIFQDHVRQGGWWDYEPIRHTMYRLGGQKVGIIGASMIGKQVMEMLKPFGCEIYLYDPYFSDQAAAAYGATKTSLEDMFKTCRVISVHAPNIPETVGMVSRSLLQSMMDWSVIINTARGPLIDHAALLDELQTGRIFACLDVTAPEPLPKDSPLRTLPNVLLTPHIAGGQSVNGRLQHGDYIVEQIRRFISGEALDFEVDPAKLSIMA